MHTVIYIYLPTFYPEMQINAEPGLQGEPVVIDQNGFVKAASSQALGLGILPGTRTSAARHCPGVTIRPYSPNLYRRGAVRVWDKVASFSPLVEPDSYEGLFLDLTGCGNPSALTSKLAAVIWDEFSLITNIGRGINKFLAKLAAWEADWHRSRQGLYSFSRVILPGAEESFLTGLPISHLWPLEAKVTQRLISLGLYTIGDVAKFPETELAKEFGAVARRLSELAHGRDNQRVLALYPPPQMEHTEYFLEGCQDKQQLVHSLCQAGIKLGELLRQSGQETRRLVLVLETEEAELTWSKWLVSSTSDEATLARNALDLLNLGQPISPVTSFRLRAEEFQVASGYQLGFFAELLKAKKEQTIDGLLSSLKGRFGLESVDLAKTYAPPRRELILSRFFG